MLRWFEPIDCPFCNSDDAYVTSLYVHSESVGHCPYCGSDFTVETGEVVVWRWDGGDDTPDFTGDC